MKVLIKLGGTLLDVAQVRDGLCAEIARVAGQGIQAVVVHGGGKQMTRFLAERGVESRFVNGLRVTTPEVLDAVLKVFAGSVNHELVSALNRAGTRAVGLSGIDACLVEAVQMDPSLGAVGRVTRANAELLDVLTSANFLPVVACVAGDRQGNVYNVNADQMAVACAAGFGAEKLIFLTDVEGVLDANGKIRPQLTTSESAQLIAEGVATGGMQAKLNAAASALAEGVGQVLIAPGAVPGVLGKAMAGQPVGTRLIAAEVQRV